MANLLFIKCITLWQILPHDLLGIGREPLMGTGIQAVRKAYGIYRIFPWQSERRRVCQVTQVQRPRG